jgi:hypothetical protein
MSLPEFDRTLCSLSFRNLECGWGVSSSRLGNGDPL